MRLHVITCLTYSPITTFTLSPLSFRERAAHPDKENIEIMKQLEQISHPALRLDNMFDNDVITGTGKRGQDLVKAVEKSGT